MENNGSARQQNVSVYPRGYRALWLAVAISLGANIWLAGKLYNLQRNAVKAADIAAATLDQARTQSISYTARVNQNVPVNAVINIDEHFSIPIKTNVPIKTTVVVPVTIPIIGEIVNLSVPIDTVVPVDTTVSVPVKKTFSVKGSSPISIDVPIEIPIADTPLGKVIDSLKSWLLKISEVAK